jgi:hypothetical protein
MPLARKNLTITDGNGNVQDGASIQFRDETTLVLPQCYSDVDGTVAIGNPYVAADGRNAGAFLVGGYYRITATLGGLVIEWRHEPVGLAAGTDFGGGGESEQQVTGASATIDGFVTKCTVNRVAPSTTGLTLPDASLRIGRDLSIADYSTSVTEHTTTLTPFQASQKIMRQSTWPLYSNASNLASVTLRAIVDPDNSLNYVWIIAP